MGVDRGAVVFLTSFPAVLFSCLCLCSHQVFARCKEWMEAPLNKPSTLDALRRSLAQLCVLKEEVDPDHVVKLLEAKGCISIDLEDKVTYL